MKRSSVVLYEVVDEDWQILYALTKGGKRNGDGVDAKEEVEPEGAFFDLRAEIGVGNGD